MTAKNIVERVTSEPVDIQAALERLVDNASNPSPEFIFRLTAIVEKHVSPFDASSPDSWKMLREALAMRTCHHQLNDDFLMLFAEMLDSVEVCEAELGRRLRNQKISWPEVAAALGRGKSDINATKQEVRRWADDNDLYCWKDKPGRKKLSEK